MKKPMLLALLFVLLGWSKAGHAGPFCLHDNWSHHKPIKPIGTLIIRSLGEQKEDSEATKALQLYNLLNRKYRLAEPFFT